VAGTSVTVTGTNYEISPATKNQTRFNNSYTPPTGSTTTTVTAAVPANTGSGRVTIKTALGTAVSANDLIIPPPPYVVSDVFSASRLSFGTATTVTVSTASKIALRLFDATHAQRVSVLGTNGLSGQVLGCDMNVSLLGPFANTVAYGCMEISGFIDTRTLSPAGTYTLLVDPASTATGSVTLTLYDVPADYSATITPGGSAVTATMGTPGQNGVLTFSGTASQRISLLGSNGMTGQIGLGVCDVNVTILNQEGAVFTPLTCMEGSGFIDVTTLAATGTYKIRVDPTQHATGNLTLTLYSVPADYSGTIAAGGSAVTLAMPTPGQNGSVTFSGTQGQRIALLGSNGLSGFVLGCDVNVTIKKPDGSPLAGPTCMEVSGYIDTQTLPATGTYTIVADPVSHAAGTLTLTLYDVPADYSGTITAGGSSVTVSMPTVGQNGTVTFSGTSGQRISLRGANGLSGFILGCDVNVTIKKPDGNPLAGPTCMEGTNGGFIETTELPTTGTYTIAVDPVNHASGNLTLTLYDVPADTTGTITISGSAVAVPLGTPGQNGSLTFSGSATQQVTVRMTGNTFGQITVKLLKPDGSQLTATTSSSASFNLATQTLPATGTYTIVVDPAGANTGTVNVSVTNP
jgi:hypothetical protein